jgi:hypothetical protein
LQALKKAQAALEGENAALLQEMQSASKALASARKECAGLRMLLADKNEMVELGARDLARAQRMVSCPHFCGRQKLSALLQVVFKIQKGSEMERVNSSLP